MFVGLFCPVEFRSSYSFCCWVERLFFLSVTCFMGSSSGSRTRCPRSATARRFMVCEKGFPCEWVFPFPQLLFLPLPVRIGSLLSDLDVKGEYLECVGAPAAGMRPGAGKVEVLLVVLMLVSQA